MRLSRPARSPNGSTAAGRRSRASRCCAPRPATPAAPLQFLQAARDAARDSAVRSVKLLGPAPAPMERRAGRYRAQLLLHAPTHSPLQKFMSAWLPHVEALPEARRVRWSIDVDPIELF